MSGVFWAELALNLGNGRRLIFAGQGGGWLWLAAGAAAVVLLLVLYRYERKMVSRRAGLALLGLRLAAAVALVLALFEPIAERVYTEKVRGRVIVGVDLSESMATRDVSRPTEERERLRQALNISPSDPVEALSRREIERRLLQGDWLKALGKQHDVELIGFARDAAAGLTVETLEDRLAHPPTGDDPQVLTTDWRPVLERGLEGQGGAPVLGVVLLTDGLQNAPGSRVEEPAADRLAARGVPIYPVLIGSTEPPPDVAIAALKAPERVSKGDAADVQVTLKLDGQVVGTEVPVILERPGAEPMRKTVVRPSDGSRPVVTFRVPLDEAGTVPLEVSVGPVEGDVRPDNDRRTVRIDVVDDRARVLLVDGEARWEFRYLRNALKRDPHVTVEAVVFHQPPAPESAEATYPSKLPEMPAEGPDPLFGYDLIVVGDVEPSDWPEGFWSRISGYVDSKGGTLVLSAGPRSWEALVADRTGKALVPVLDPRPLSPPAEAGGERPSLPPGVRVMPAEGMEREPWPMLRFSAEAAESRAIWEGLPGLPWVLGGRAKPLASVLVRAEETNGASSDASAVIVAMPYGLGQVLWVGTDATWRWRYRTGDAYHHRFWGQVVRWANASKLVAGNALVRFGPLHGRSPEGRPTAIRARFSEDASGVTSDLMVAARVFRVKAETGEDSALLEPEGEAVAVVPLRASSDQPRVFEGSVPGLPPGSYGVKLEVPGRGDAPEALAPLEVASEETPERVELAAARDPLERLAAPNQGRVVRDYEAEALGDLISGRVEPRRRVEPTTLWDQPAALVLFFAVLAVEWMLRKRVGLP